uniref:Ribosomal protein S7 domain-containing protein n=1 Tax=Aegilops tauschii subsp. strangulata TaxID=200361 RepID=A0A453GPK4_AEGTS
MHWYPHNRVHGCNGKKIMAVRIIKHTTEIIDLLTDGEGFQMLKEDNRNFCDVLSSIFFSLM